MEGLFTAPEKLVLLWCPGLSGLVAGVPLDAAGVSPGCRRMLPGCRRMSLGSKRPAEVFAAHSIWDG